MSDAPQNPDAPGASPAPNPTNRKNTMTDLRTRIAKVLHARFASSMGMADVEWDDEHRLTQDEWRKDADAVIRELKLEPEYRFFPNDPPLARYVTEWTANYQEITDDETD